MRPSTRLTLSSSPTSSPPCACCTTMATNQLTITAALPSLSSHQLKESPRAPLARPPHHPTTKQAIKRAKRSLKPVAYSFPPSARPSLQPLNKLLHNQKVAAVRHQKRWWLIQRSNRRKNQPQLRRLRIRVQQPVEKERWWMSKSISVHHLRRFSSYPLSQRIADSRSRHRLRRR